MEQRFFLVEAGALPEVFRRVARAKEMLASGEAASVSAAVRAVGLSRSAFYKYKDSIFDAAGSRETLSIVATLRDETGALQALLATISAAGASILTINQSPPANGTAQVTVTVRAGGMSLTAEELAARLRGQRTVIEAHCGL